MAKKRRRATKKHTEIRKDFVKREVVYRDPDPDNTEVSLCSPPSRLVSMIRRIFGGGGAATST